MRTQVLIIGGGATGTGLVRDLALRGVDCILVDTRDLNAGASGANHGLLHSGGRYAKSDPHSAQECKEEGDILKKLAPHVIEDTGGFFLAVEGDDEKYIADFEGLCRNATIDVAKVDPKDAMEMEPAISRKTIACYSVPDANIDPFRLGLDNVSQAVSLGSRFMRRTRLAGFDMENGTITAARMVNMRTGEEFKIVADQYVNAGGAWAGEVAAMAGAEIGMLYAKGTLLITHDRLTKRVINRLRPPGDGDILVPGGTVSILGTTSVRVDSLDNIQPTIAEVDVNVEQGMPMVPELATTRYIRAYAGVRPLLTGTADSDRNASRGVALMGHEREGLKNFISITGGKLTTYRLMAEMAGDLVCERLGVSASCLTRTEPLPAADPWMWSDPGHAARGWLEKHDQGDVLLCECEMVPKSGVDRMLGTFDMSKDKPGLKALGRRSRVGKGSCQGTFCSLRLTSYLYDKDYLHGDEGVRNLREFLEERWKGQRTILWGMAESQAELQEAFYCGLMGIELGR
ncbi:anaerobic glycerol-3-phosphate dehydrogenase subunit GlpA [Salidesulfovibrio onnuriiensis]|uniref:anaerobic glycerol-3-phosphate dehydrogenase subunit GlpA n=1 Tax=Salidesulfovibrio onnuriiensis TaxID=2583823 RepID=UPI0011C7635B|nr:anaerobic glycerol-3-phosphate dehydrogenase subunit GlpA [Salidesulfovibrio onnuriiensis]